MKTDVGVLRWLESGKKIKGHFSVFLAPFSLIELLIVTSIIAILAAMLLPALQKTRDRAHSASCRNNLKNLALGLALYANDYQDYAIPAIDGKKKWTAYLFVKEYFGNVRLDGNDMPDKPGVGLCPGNDYKYYNPSTQKGFMNYVYNINLGWHSYHKFNFLKMPSEKATLGDGYQKDGYTYSFTNGPDAASIIHPRRFGSIFAPHTKQVNLAYADAHIGQADTMNLHRNQNTIIKIIW